MSVAPDVLFYMTIFVPLVGAVEFLLGVWQFNQADNAKKFVGCVLQGSGLGFMAAGAVFYLAKGFDWALLAGLGVMVCGSMGGSLSGIRFAKKQRGLSQ